MTATSRPRRSPKLNVPKPARWILGIGALIATVSAVYFLTPFLRDQATSGADGNATRSIRVSRGVVEGRAVATGALALVQTSTVTPQASGVLRELRVAVGDAVEKDEVIAILDTSALKADLTKAELALDTERAKLAQAKAPYTESDVSAARAAVEAARAKLESASAPYGPTEITAAELAIEQAKLKLEQTKAPYSEADVAAQRTAVQQAEYQLASARNNLVVVQKGATVSKNVRDAEYEHNWYEVNHGKALAQHEAGEADENKVTLAWNNLMSAKEKLDTARAQAAQALSSAENQIAQAETSLASARDKLATMEAPSDPLDIRAAQLAVDQAAVKLATMRAGSSSADVESAKANLLSAEQKLESMRAGPDELAIRIAQNAVDAGQATVDDLRAQIAETEVRSPASGTVISLGTSGAAPAVGSSVSQTTVLAAISDLSRLQVAASVNEVDAAQVRKGQKADVDVTALPGKTFAGEVVAIDSQATTNQGVVSYALVVALEADAVAAGLKPGMSASARVLTGRSERAVLVPVEALQRLRGNWAVLVRGENGALQPRPVDLGIIGTTHAEVTKGLSDGEMIEVAATRGATTNTSGQRQQGGFQSGQPGGGVPQVPTNPQPRR